MTANGVVYSIGVRFAAGGIGDIAYHGVSGLYRHGMLHRLLCGSYRSTEVCEARIRALGYFSRLLRKLALYDQTKNIIELHDHLYDYWAYRQVERCDVFLTWNGFGLRALRSARILDATTVVYRASSHPVEQTELLQEEYARWRQPLLQSKRRVERAVDELEEGDYIIIPSDFVRRSCLKHGIAANKLIEIPFGVDTSRFRPPEEEVPEQPFRVLFAGQIGIRKGVPYLLQAWDRLGWKNAELWLMGLVQADFKQRLQPYRNYENVRFLGHVEDPAAAMRQVHLFVFPTIEEGSALVVYEAMASGLAVITTPNAGSLIQDGRDGQLIEIRDVTALVEQMEMLRRDQERRRELGRAARRRIEEYTWQRYGDRLAQALVAMRRANA